MSLLRVDINSAHGWKSRNRQSIPLHGWTTILKNHLWTIWYGKKSSAFIKIFFEVVLISKMTQNIQTRVSILFICTRFLRIEFHPSRAILCRFLDFQPALLQGLKYRLEFPAHWNSKFVLTRQSFFCRTWSVTFTVCTGKLQPID